MLTQRGKNHFVPTPVTLGQRYGSDIKIVSGVEATDCVVVSTNFCWMQKQIYNPGCTG